MSENIKSPEQLRSDLQILKKALQEPKLYAHNLIDELRNEIDIQSQIEMKNEETKKNEILNHQEQMITCLNEFVQVNFSDLPADQLPHEDLQSTIDKIELDLSQADESLKIEDFNEKISTALLSIQKIVIRNKSIIYIKKSEFCESFEEAETQALLGAIFIIEDELIDKETLLKA